MLILSRSLRILSRSITYKRAAHAATIYAINMVENIIEGSPEGLHVFIFFTRIFLDLRA